MNKSNRIGFPREGMSKDQLFKSMEARRSGDLKWQDGKSFCLIYYPGKEKSEMVKEAYNMFFTENALNPISFPSLKQFETEVINMVSDLLNGKEEVTGCMTSGGTESIILTVSNAREYAQKILSIKQPEIILPVTGHPSFVKACHYLGIKPVHVPVRKDYRADMKAVKKAINKNTVMLVCSAPSYPHGVIDPVAEFSELALKNKLLLHVDACIGGFMLPFARKLGYPIPDFDFSLEGVTSMSVDIHKYGYSAKGASVVLYKNAELRKHQFFVYTQWPGGVYGSPTILGSRPGGAIAAAWAAIKGIGEKGYLDMAKTTLETTGKIKKAIEAIPELEIMGKPDMSIIAFKPSSDQFNIYELADELNIKGWNFERIQLPAGIHLTINQIHSKKVADAFLKDLRSSIEKVKKFSFSKLSTSIQVSTVKRLVKILPEGVLSKLQSQFTGSSAINSDRTAAMYGMMGVLQGTGDLDDIVVDLLDKIYSSK